MQRFGLGDIALGDMHFENRHWKGREQSREVFSPATNRERAKYPYSPSQPMAAIPAAQSAGKLLDCLPSRVNVKRSNSGWNARNPVSTFHPPGVITAC